MYRTIKRVLFKADIDKGELVFDDIKKFHHLSNVMKLKSGDNIRVFNQKDGEWLAEIVKITKNKVTSSVIKKIRDREEESGIQIAFAPIKPDRLRFLIEKATEIGVDGFIPVITSRTVIKAINKQKIALYITGAVEQSERITVPFLSEICNLKDFLNYYNNSTIIFCNEDEQIKMLSAIELKENYIILIGPEGGFTEEEKFLLAAYPNVVSVKLSNNILRSETASILALGNIMSKMYKNGKI